MISSVSSRQRFVGARGDGAARKEPAKLTLSRIMTTLRTFPKLPKNRWRSFSFAFITWKGTYQACFLSTAATASPSTTPLLLPTAEASN